MRVFGLAAVLTLAVHGLVAVLVPVPGSFEKYPAAAELYLAGELASERLADFSPLYFHVAVFAERFLPAGALPVTQLVFASLAAGWLALLLRRYLPRRPWLTAGAVAVFILDRHLLVYERILEPEVFLLAAVLAWVFFVEASLDDERLAWPAGVAAALAFLLRPTFLPLYAAVPLLLRLRLGNWRATRRRTLAFALPVVLAVGLLALRQVVLTGDVRTPVMNPGTVFYEGNNLLSRGTSAVYPPLVLELVGLGGGTEPDPAHAHYRTVARAATGRDLTPAEVNAYWSGLAVDAIRAEPGRALGLLREKLQRALHGYRWHDVQLAWHLDRLLWTPSLPFAAVSALALLGLVLGARRLREMLLLYLVAGTQLAVMLVFYVSARQRLVLVPFLVVFAAAAVGHLLEKRRRALPVLLLAVVLAAVLSLPDDLVRDDAYRRGGEVTGGRLLAELHERTETEPVAAHASLALDALVRTPWVKWTPAFLPQEERSLAEQLAVRLEEAKENGELPLPALFDLAAVELRAGRLDRAEALLRDLAAADVEVYRGAEAPSRPRLLLARVAARRGDTDGAVTLLLEALDRAPGDPFVVAELVVLDGEEPWRPVLERGLSPLDAAFLLGRAYLAHGRDREAADALRLVVERLPELRSGHLDLAVALAGIAGLDEKKVDAAAEHFLAARRLAPDPLLRSRAVGDLVERWAALHPEDVRVRLLAARALHENGMPRRALAVLEELEGDAAASDREAVRRTLRHLRPKI